MTPAELANIRSQFPILSREVHGKPLVYFDNAATVQKPQSVIETLNHYYSAENSNIHRGVHYLSQEATRAFEEARENIRQFVNAGSSCEIIFTRGTTESINLVASGVARAWLKPGDSVLISAMEHHSNIVPWQMACEQAGARLNVIPMDHHGVLFTDELEKLLMDKCKILAITHISNALGTINPVKEIIKRAHGYGVPVLVDGAQAVPHLRVDVTDLDCDFYCFSGHKMYGPMGVGVLYGKENLLNGLPPYQGGGEMIRSVSFEKTTYNELPFKFEAGTPNVGDVLALKTAIDFIAKTGYPEIAEHEKRLVDYATLKLNEIPGIRIIGQAPEKASVLSFLIGDIHPYDAGTILDHMGIAVRTGHHCAQPLMDFLKIPGTIRASFAIYNTTEEIDRLVEGILLVKKMFD